MKELHKLESYDIEIIESFITNEIEESLHIEYKSSGALSKADSVKKEISKDVSAFANSDGGIIIYGMSEKEHKASELSFINGNIFTKEWLEQVISTTINRNIPNLRIFPIRKDGDIEKTIYVVQIPMSIETPHLSRDKRYYRRYNFESVPMEEYEIRQLYGRTIKSKLILNGYSISVVNNNDPEITEFLCETGVINKGEKFEKDYKVNVYFENINEFVKINWNVQGPGRNYDHTKLDGGKTIKITNTTLPPIYPKESVNAIRFNFEISNFTFEETIKNLKIRFHLFYPNGEDVLETDLIEIGNKIMNQ